MKILLLDIETSPNLAYVWGIWEQNVRMDQMVTSSSTLCWAAKWHGDKKVEFDSVYKSGEKKMLKRVHALLCEADVVVHYNGKKFDVPTLNKEFLLNGMTPPSPYRQIDMLEVARSKFRFQSNKLDYVAQQLGLDGKVAHEGFELWVKCMANDAKAWATMEKYNKNDVVLLEKVYERMLPWITNHPNRNLYDNTEACHRCGSEDLNRRGTAHTVGATYQRYQCKSCGGWQRGTKEQTRAPARYKEIK